MCNYTANNRRNCLRCKYRRFSCNSLIVSNLICIKYIGVLDPSQIASVVIINPLTRLNSNESSTAGVRYIKVTQLTLTGHLECLQL